MAERSSSGAGNTDSELGTQYCFKWSNYQSHLAEVMRELLEEESMVDVTIAAGGERIQAHRLVLCACSSLFADLLCHVNEEHSTIILSDIAAQDIRSIVEFSYNGEVRIPVENINNLLHAAHFLKIYGLMEIEGLDETEVSNEKDISAEETYLDETVEYEDNKQAYGKGNINKKNEEKKRKSSDSDSNLKYTNVKRRKSVCKRDYTDDMLTSALDEIRKGGTLLEAAAKHRIPRSTLYMRAKALGVTLNPCRNEYTLDDMKQAIEAVLTGSSLQQAADMHGIPKTVLWRRIQKEGYRSNRHDTRKNYHPDRREAAVKALQRGEGLTKVANEYNIPKTTLFRDKARLVDQGILPSTFWKRRKTNGENYKQVRLEEAVAACKNGKMSQGTAAATYHIPKTTIWRRLQKDNKKSDSDSPFKKSPKKSESSDTKSVEIVKAEELNEGDFEAYCPEDGEMSITYIDESNMSEDPVIILASGDVDDLNLPNNRSLVVVQEEDNGDKFISCGLELDDTSFVEKS